MVPNGENPMTCNLQPDETYTIRNWEEYVYMSLGTEMGLHTIRENILPHCVANPGSSAKNDWWEQQEELQPRRSLPLLLRYQFQEQG